MTRRPITTVEKMASAERRKRRTKLAVLMAREQIPSAEILEATGLPGPSVDKIVEREAEIREAEEWSRRPLHQQFNAIGWTFQPCDFDAEVPAEPPPSSVICLDCLRKWIHYNRERKKMKLHQHRAVTCCHMPGTDQTKYSVAFVVKSDPPSWLLLANVPPSRMNELSFDLTLSNGRHFVRIQEIARAKATKLAADHRRKQLIELGLLMVAAKVAS